MFRTSLILLVLTPIASAQRVSLSDVRCGRDAHLRIEELRPNSRAFLRTSLVGQEPARRLTHERWLAADASGRAHWDFELPAASAGCRLEVLVGTLAAGAGVTRTRLAVTVAASAPSRFGPGSDSFGGNALDPAWSVLNPSLVSIQVSGGQLHLTSTASGAPVSWFADAEGPFVHKTVSGDFDVTTRAHARSSSTPGAPVPPRYRLGGLMVRDTQSAPGNRNSAHIVIGAGDQHFPVAVEDKTTVGSNSDFFFHAIPTSDLELRITRAGDLVSRFYRAPGTDLWTLMRADNHPEFAPEVQVGLIVYCFESPADLVASFDQIVFQ